MLKVAFMLIEQHCAEQNANRGEDQALKIVGLYVAHPSGKTDQLDFTAKAIAEKIAEQCGDASLWAVDLKQVKDGKNALLGHLSPEFKLMSGDNVTVDNEA